jgi:glycosyltransferase involved in cell wall biosynthesis
VRHGFSSIPERCHVIPLGVDAPFFASSAISPEAVRARYSLPERYILTVGTLEPRKNLEGLLAGYARTVRERPNVPHLVVAGRMGWQSSHLPDLVQALGISDRAHFPGFIDDACMPTVYRSADAFACVSLYEGFGLPVLEAMASGTPVVASNVSSIPEVAGDCAILVNPRDTASIAGGFVQLLDNPEEAKERAAQGRTRARQFTWDSCAKATLEAYENALVSPGRR